MDSVKEFLSRMNDVSFQYVILRNFEGLPEEAIIGEHGDIDLLVCDIDHWMEIFPDAERVYPSPRVQFRQPIGDSFIQVDVRYVGDGYYPTRFENDILKNREWNKNGFFMPVKQDHLVALAYHCYHHKGGNTYPELLGDMTMDELGTALKNTGIGWTQPDDPSVGAYNQYLQGATSIVEKGDGKVLKTQNSYKDYSLIDNEARILERCNSKHIPKLLGRAEEGIEIEDCGEHLIVDNLPYNWKEQLVDIVKYLKKVNVKHNDIKLDNFMIKDDTIKLIDFGWGSLKEEDTSHFPDCLGVPNRYYLELNDNYSMGCVIRQIQYMIDEQGGEVNE